MTDQAFSAALEATWPPARSFRTGGWIIREGLGGGQRVSAATAEGPEAAAQIAQAEQAMRDLGQGPVFMLRPGEEALDRALAEHGYVPHDPVVIYAGEAAAIADPAPDPLSGFPHWPPLAIAADLWAGGGIGPARLAVMDRVPGPKCAILGRSGDHAAGVAFCAVHDATAVVHAVHVDPRFRRRGLGAALMRHAALWAGGQGAHRLVLAVTRANAPARTLYRSLGMDEAGGYHYRVPTAEPAGH